MNAKIKTVQPVLMSRDVSKSVEFYKKLGFKLHFSDSATNPTYAGIRRNQIELHIQWHHSDEWNFPNDRPTYRFTVDDVDILYTEFLKAGIKDLKEKEPQKTPWNTYEFHILDPDSNGLQFYKNL